MSGWHPYVVDLTGDAAAAALALAGDAAREYGTVESPDLQAEALTIAQELPRDVRRALNAFRLSEPSCVCLVRGLPVDDAALGPTPRTRAERERGGQTAAEVFFYLCAALLGDPIAWSTKHSGRIMHTIAPLPEDEDEQLASSSTTPLTWHTEDAFHPLRADYVALLCLRNPDGVPTTVGCVDNLTLPPRVREVLSQPRFTITPDGSQLASGGMAAMAANPEPVPLLFGAQDAPYLRLDQFYTRPLDSDAEARSALDSLLAATDASLSRYALRPGEVCIVDNYRAVHGRDSFRARYDGTDRWLRRLNIARDLRRSRALRAAPAVRVLGTSA
ncbi:guanitoxin biosynthesis L-enduracididine beta-hydroxylase GntD [Phytohabitans houttuyneae]|uniref:L-asparagine oxygenase n=1 Tax=Phytohabitans houttuyneae TaxID=1076126 RepID=A0A6V8JZ25_9ACTN|nr:guanitoxin biosynthesis L-enduracididine beta-hydroxylase GntD [Phytohabitans houttuyneae]GFJ78022.1 L-asparagine oxygenase [Phytohabitans houttuyneae]